MSRWPSFLLWFLILACWPALAFSQEQPPAAASEKTSEKENSSATKKLLPEGDPRTMSPVGRLDVLKRIEERLAELQLKEMQVDKNKAELKKQQEDVEVRLQDLEKLKAELAGVLDRKVQEDVEAVQEMTKVYEAMSAKAAAQVFETLDIDMTRAVLRRMSKKKAAEILNKLPKDRAVKLSEYYAGFSGTDKDRVMNALDMSDQEKKKNAGGKK